MGKGDPFQLPGRKGVWHLCGMVGSAEMPQTQFQTRWSLENCCKEVVSAFSSLTIQIVGYYMWSLKIFLKHTFEREGLLRDHRHFVATAVQIYQLLYCR